MTENMSDRELLEMASRAYLDKSWHGNEAYMRGFMSAWNPLTDDGDALRLAVACQLGISIVGGRTGIVECVSFKELHCFVSSREIADDGDIESATRRAIVRAAAEIGRQM